jgi:hypothetical protein
MYEGPIKALFEEVRGKLEAAVNALLKDWEGDTTGTCNPRWTTRWAAWPSLRSDSYC